LPGLLLGTGPPPTLSASSPGRSSGTLFLLVCILIPLSQSNVPGHDSHFLVRRRSSGRGNTIAIVIMLPRDQFPFDPEIFVGILLEVVIIAIVGWEGIVLIAIVVVVVVVVTIGSACHCGSGCHGDGTRRDRRGGMDSLVLRIWQG